MPNLILDSLPDPIAVHHFGLDIQGLEHVTIAEASGFGSTHEAIEQRENGNSGKSFFSIQPGNLKWEDVTLKRGATDDKSLFEWRQQVVDGNLDVARKSGSIIFYDARDQELARVNIVRCWPSKWSLSGVKVSDNQPITEELILKHEGLTLA